MTTMEVGALPGAQEELMKQLRAFLQGAAGGGRGALNPRLASTAIHLLTHLPASREAVFEYYSVVLDAAVGRYNPANNEGGPGSQAAQVQLAQAEDEERIIGDLQKVLSGFIESNPTAWAPIISKWSLDSLGRLSSKYSGKICGKQSASGMGSLNEKVSSWLGCLAARTLLDLAAECLAKLMHDDTESCVAALLDTSVRHTPHFDWVVAHLGSCFPNTVIRRVLTVGLKDFITQATAQVQQDGAVNLSKVPKFVSVVNILSHLAATHQTDLQQAVHQLLLTSLDHDSSHLATVPYLLNLASLSTFLRRALTQDLANKLTQQVTERIAVLAPAWVSSYFPAGNSLLNLATHLLQSTDRGGPALLGLLLDRGKESVGSVPKYCRTIVHLLLAEIFQQVHGVMRHRTDEVPVFSGLADSMPVFLKLLLSENSFQVQASTQLMALYALHKGRSVSVHMVKFMLFSSTTAAHLRVLTELLKQIEIFHFNCVTDAVAQSLRSREGSVAQLLDNLAKLVAHEKQQQEGAEPAYRSSFTTAVRLNQAVLVERLCRRDVTPLVLELFQLVPPSSRMRVALLHKICHHFVHVIFITVEDSQLGEEEKVKRVYQCEAVLKELRNHQTGLQIILRFMIDACLNSGFSSLLGGQQECEDNVEASVRQRQASSLLKANLKFGSMPVQLGPATVFHAGVIGAGARPPPQPPNVDTEQAERNRRIVAGVIIRLCEDQGAPFSSSSPPPPGPGEGNKQLALMLVEVVSPDIMYNGLPWPEEDFMKVTVERDLAIARLLDRHPILWTLLELLASQRPALCYCSVIMRAVLALSIAHWQSSVASKVTDHGSATAATTRKVLELMSVGQFLPPQLAVVPQITEVMNSFQLHCVLIDIWNFMKVNVPGPNLFTLHEPTGLWNRDFGPYSGYKVYCERLRVIMVQNIDKVSAEFKRSFVDVMKEPENGHTETP